MAVFVSRSGESGPVPVPQPYQSTANCFDQGSKRFFFSLKK